MQSKEIILLTTNCSQTIELSLFVLIMKKYFFKIFLLLFLIVSCNKKEDRTKPITYLRVSDGNSWGFTDNSGKSIIPFGKYVFLNLMDEKGMIFAQKGSKYGYIDINQNIIIPFEYDELSLFSNELASAKKNEKFGFVNRKGLVVIPFQYEEESSFGNNGIAMVKTNDKFGFINKSGKEIIPIIFQEAKETTLDSLVVVSINGKWALFSDKGKQKSNFIYDEITFSKIGLIYVRKNEQIGYLDFNLNEVIPFGKYTFGDNFNQNKLAIVSKNNHFGVINEFGKEVIRTEYDTLEHPQKDYAESSTFVAQKNNYFILFDEKGKKVADKIKEYSFDRVTIKNKNKSIYIIQNLSGFTGIIGGNGKVIIPAIYDEIEPFRGQSKTVVKYKGKYGLIDSNNQIIYPTDNDYIESYKDQDYYIIKKKDKVGIIDRNLKTIFDFAYQDLSPCFYDKNNRFIAKQNNLYGVIDKKKRIIIPFEYSKISNWVEYGPGSNYHFVTKNNKKGLITKEGKTIIPVIYDTFFYKDDKAIILSKNKKYGVVTIQYKPVIPFIYNAIYIEFSNFNEGDKEFYVEKQGKYFVVNNKNIKIRTNLSAEEMKDRFYFNRKFLKE